MEGRSGSVERHGRRNYKPRSIGRGDKLRPIGERSTGRGNGCDDQRPIVRGGEGRTISHENDVDRDDDRRPTGRGDDRRRANGRGDVDRSGERRSPKRGEQRRSIGRGDVDRGGERRSPGRRHQRRSIGRGRVDCGGERRSADRGNERRSADRGNERRSADRGGERRSADRGNERRSADRGNERRSPGRDKDRRPINRGSQRRAIGRVDERRSRSRSRGRSRRLHSHADEQSSLGYAADRRSRWRSRPFQFRHGSINRRRSRSRPGQSRSPHNRFPEPASNWPLPGFLPSTVPQMEFITSINPPHAPFPNQPLTTIHPPPFLPADLPPPPPPPPPTGVGCRVGILRDILMAEIYALAPGHLRVNIQGGEVINVNDAIIDLIGLEVEPVGNGEYAFLLNRVDRRESKSLLPNRQVVLDHLLMRVSKSLGHVWLLITGGVAP